MPKKTKPKPKRPLIDQSPEAHDRAVMRAFRQPAIRQRRIRALAKQVLRERDKTQQTLRALAAEILLRLGSHPPAEQSTM